MPTKLLLVLLCSLLPMRAGAAKPDESAEAVFKQLHSLVGTWEGKFADGRSHTVSYRLTAGDTVLVETWTLSRNRESLTLYSLDGTSLIATHYCPQGNQPRLQLVGGSGREKMSFEFRDGTNLQIKGKSHQHAFWLRILGDNSFERSETYVENGSTPAEIAKAASDKPVTYTRAVVESR